MQRVLTIAFHFPPAAISSGHLRTLALTRYLPEFGWEPTVLTANRRAYSQIDEHQLSGIPESTRVKTAFALDTKRHLGIRGSYPLMLAQPDRWVAWWLGAIPAGLFLIRKYRPALIWSTYPIATAHLIGWTLHRITGIPWVADFRDPVKSEFALSARTQDWIERGTIARAARSVFTTPSARRVYQSRYPDYQGRFCVVPNGFDERAFESAAGGVANGTEPGNRQLKLVHSGLLYREGRNPEAFFQALKMLRDQDVLSADRLHVVLRASGHEEEYAARLEQLGIADMVSLEAPLDYQRALAEQMQADGLLLFQGRIYNAHIPAKIYEYLRTGRPILAFADDEGDTAELLRTEGLDTIAPLDSPERIAEQLKRFVQSFDGDSHLPLPSQQRVAAYSRQALVGQYAKIFDAACATMT